MFRFIRWMKQLDEHGKEPRTGALESRNAVQIISIHHSKGLEYPIVFLADTAHKINLQDRNSDVLIHPSLGIGGRVIDSSRGISYPTIALRAISAKLTQESLSEEMRVLYGRHDAPQGPAHHHGDMENSRKDARRAARRSHRPHRAAASRKERLAFALDRARGASAGQPDQNAHHSRLRRERVRDRAARDRTG